MSQVTRQGLGLFTLVMLITGAIDSIRNLPATALFGSDLIFFFLLAAVLFLLPTALVSAELSALFTKESGVFAWVKRAFGEKTAFLAIWLQWINTMVWYPTILSFLAGTAAYLIDPTLATHKALLVSVILITFWGMTFFNLFGIETSARFASLCTVFGMIIPMSFIIGLAAIWCFTGHALQIHFSSTHLLPDLSHTTNWVSFTAIMASFVGMELSAVHVNHVADPQKNYPRAILMSVAIIITTLILGSLAIAIVLPHDQINLVDGVMQAFQNFLQAYDSVWLLPILGVMLFIGSLGSMVSWIISPAKGLLQAADHGLLPQFFTKRNRFGVAQNVLLVQACLVTFVCLAFLFMPSVNGSYWLLTDLSTQLYVLMYVFMFLAAIVIRYRHGKVKRPFKIPGGTPGYYFTCGLGILACVITLIVGFFPPEGIDVGGRAHYEIIFSLGLIAMIAPAFLCFKRSGKRALDSASHYV